jgi:TP901 family phage tail tape measure protein
MSETRNGGPLSFLVNIDGEKAKKDAEGLKKAFDDLKKAGGGSFDKKGLTEYQEGLLKIKKETLEFAKAKDALNRSQKEGLPGISAYNQAQLGLQKSLSDARIEVQRLIQVNQGLKNELEQGKIAAQNNRVEVEKLKIAEQDLKNALLQGKISQQQYTEEVNKNKVAQSELNKTLTEAAIKDKEAATRLKEHALEQKKLVAAAKETREAMKNVSGSYFEAQKRLSALGQTIKSTESGFNKMTPELRAQIKEYNTLNDKLKQFDATMGNHQRNVGNYKSALEGLRGYLTTYLGAQAILAGGAQIIRQNAELSDSLSDVRRTAGLTAAEADNLATQLKKIDTRTSLKGLMDIAIIGGQLGIAKDQLGGFTSAVNQLAVSLSGELEGGAEGIAKSLGVLDNVFGVSKANAGDVEKSFNQIGSAILGLGQSGLATGDFLTDFSERVGGLAKQAGISLPVILSYGAVLQENGVSAEVAGSAFKRLLAALSTNREKFFAVAKLADANLTLKDFTNTINTDAKGALDLFFAGLAKGGTSTTSFNDILKTLKLTGVGVSQAVAALANGQESLNGHINDATKDFNEATLSAEQYALKNDNLAGSMEKLVNVFVNATTSGAIGNFFKGVVDWLTVSLKEFSGLVNSAGWKEFWSRLSNNSGDVFELNSGFTSNSKKTNANQQFLYPAGGSEEALAKKLADRGEKFNQQYVSKLQKTMDEAAGIVKKYEEGIKSGNVKVDKDLEKDYKANYQKAKSYYEDVYKLQEKLGFAKKAAGQVTPSTPAGTTTTTKAEAKAFDSALKRQRALQAEIDALTRKGVASKLSADQQEIVSVEEKYRKLREKAIAFNNSKDSKGQKVNVSGLNAAETAEKLEVTQKAEATVLKASLTEQAKYYAEFEDLKNKIGEDKAKARYANLIDVDKNYLESLQDQYDQLTIGKAKGGEEIEANPFAMKLLDEQIAAATLVQQKAQDDLLAEFMSYQEKRKVLTEKYNKQMILLADDEESKALRTEQYQRELGELDDTNAKKLTAFQTLFDGVDRLSDENARKVVANAEVMLNSLLGSGKISKELADEIRKLLGNTNKEIADRMPERIINLANQIDRVADAVSEVDEGFGKMLHTVGNVLGQVGNIKKYVGDLKLAQGNGDMLGQLSAGLGMFGAAMSVFSSLSKLFDGTAKAAKDDSDRREAQSDQIERLNDALERQIDLIDQAYGTDKLLKYSEALTKITVDTDTLNSKLSGRFTFTGDNTLDRQIALFNAGDKGALGFIKNLNDLDKFKLPTDLKALVALMDAGKLDESSQQIVKALQDIEKQAIQLANSLKADTIGSSLDSIADDFIENLTDGTQGFGKTFEDTVRTSLINGFKGNQIQQQLQGFYDQWNCNNKLDIQLSCNILFI